MESKLTKEQVNDLIELTLIDMRKAQMLGGEHYHVMPVKENSARTILDGFAKKLTGEMPLDKSLIEIKGHGVSQMNAKGELDGMLGGLTSESVDSSVTSIPEVNPKTVPHATELDSPYSDSEVHVEDIPRDELGNPQTIITPQVGAANESTQREGQSPVAEETNAPYGEVKHHDLEYPTSRPVESEKPVVDQSNE